MNPRTAGARPRILDLYSCAGGAGVGYHRAGFDVVGVDIDPQPNYPFEFHQADAIEYALEHGHRFDAAHASPPCQGYCGPTRGTNAGRNTATGRTHPDLIAPTRDSLLSLGIPFVIENVAGAPISKDLMLCGEMFKLGVLRHRWFELGHWSTDQPPHLKHRGRVRGWRHGQWFDGPYVADYGKGGGKATITEMQDAKNMHWTNVHHELTEAIPPAYTTWIGTRLHAALTTEAAA